jgi:hypothetical protein
VNIPVPSRFLPAEIRKDVERLRHALQRCGQLRLVLNENGLTLFAYER